MDLATEEYPILCTGLVFLSQCVSVVKVSSFTECPFSSVKFDWMWAGKIALYTSKFILILLSAQHQWARSNAQLCPYHNTASTIVVVCFRLSAFPFLLLFILLSLQVDSLFSQMYTKLLFWLLLCALSLHAIWLFSYFWASLIKNV